LRSESLSNITYGSVSARVYLQKRRRSISEACNMTEQCRVMSYINQSLLAFIRQTYSSKSEKQRKSNTENEAAPMGELPQESAVSLFKIIRRTGSSRLK